MSKHFGLLQSLLPKNFDAIVYYRILGMSMIHVQDNVEPVGILAAGNIPRTAPPSPCTSYLSWIVNVMDLGNTLEVAVVSCTIRWPLIKTGPVREGVIFTVGYLCSLLTMLTNSVKLHKCCVNDTRRVFHSPPEFHCSVVDTYDN